MRKVDSLSTHASLLYSFNDFFFKHDLNTELWHSLEGKALYVDAKGLLKCNCDQFSLSGTLSNQKDVPNGSLNVPEINTQINKPDNEFFFKLIALHTYICVTHSHIHTHARAHTLTHTHTHT